MNNHDKILAVLRSALDSGAVSRDEVIRIANSEVVNKEPQEVRGTAPARISVVDVIFYISGIVLFAAIIAYVAQLSAQGAERGLRLALTLGLGLLMWAYVAFLDRRSKSSRDKNSVAEGVISSLSLTGSLLTIAGIFIFTIDYIDTNTKLLPPTVLAIGLILLSAIHVFYSRMIRSNFILLIGIFLSPVAAIIFLFSFYDYIDINFGNIYVITAIVFSLFLAYLTRLVVQTLDKPELKFRFDGTAVFFSMLTMYIGTFAATAILWYIAIIASVISLFYISIRRQKKSFLGIASVFLIATIITIAFRYFSGFGVAFSLIVSAVGILITAVIATNINRKYLK